MRGATGDQAIATGRNGETGGVTLENNWLGNVIEPLSNGLGDDYPAARVQPIISWGDASSKINVLIRFNSFDYRLDVRPEGAFDNVRVVANILGAESYCPAAATFDSNVFIATAACGSNAVTVASPPYARVAAPIDFHLTGGPAADMAAATGADYALETDYDGDARAAPRDVGADEQ